MHPSPIIARSLRNTVHQTRHLRPAPQSFRRLSQLSYQTHSPPHIIYSNPRRLRSFGLAVLATSQASFWGYTAYLSHSVPEPLISSAWTFGGFGLSAAFAGLISTYLRRNVADICLVDTHSGPGIVLRTHSFVGVGRQHFIPAREIIGGVSKEGERYWTFAQEGSGLRLYYMVDLDRGVQDREAVKAVASGGTELLVLSHRRDAGRMRRRWEEWKEGAHG